MSTEIDRGKRWAEDQKELGLQYLAAHGGSAAKAREAMIDDGREHVPPKNTLWEWKTRYEDRFKELRAIARENADQDAADAFQRVRARAIEEADETLNHYADKRDKISPDALARSLKELGIFAGVASDKAHLLQGKPFVVEHRVNLTLVQKAIAQLEQELEDEANTVDAEVVEPEEPARPQEASRASDTPYDFRTRAYLEPQEDAEVVE